MIIVGAIAFVFGTAFGVVVTAVLAADRVTETGKYWKGYDDGFQAGKRSMEEDDFWEEDEDEYKRAGDGHCDSEGCESAGQNQYIGQHHDDPASESGRPEEESGDDMEEDRKSDGERRSGRGIL